MKKFVYLIILIIFPLLGCSNEPDDEYYVKYHFVADAGRKYVTFTIRYTNSPSSNSDSQLSAVRYGFPWVKRSKFDEEVVCGPFKYNDKVSLEMFNEENVYDRLLEIYVSKNDSPFSLRNSTKENLIEYTIDY